MANLYTVVGLFDRHQQAEGAIRALDQEGFRKGEIHQFRQQASVSAIHDQGVPEEDAAIYAEGIRRGGTVLMVRAEDKRADRCKEIMDRFGAVDLDHREREYQQAGWTRPETTGRTETAGRGARGTGEERHIPIVEERLAIGKRGEARKVRIYSRVTEHPVEEEVRLRDEKVTVERHPTSDRPIRGEDAFEEKVIEVTETHERPVVGKEAHVTEEVVIGKEETTHTEKVRDKLRKTDVKVQQAGAGGRGTGEEDANTAYQYGYTMSRDPRFRDRSFDSVEPELRRDFESNYPGTAWDSVRDSIRKGWGTTGKR